MAPRRQRREYLDWLRGVAVLLMIDAHLFDSWTGASDRHTAAFRLAMLIGGGGTTLFLFLAGVSVALSAGSKARNTGSESGAARAVALRGGEIFGLAFLFRLQAWFLGWSHRAMDLLKVDILNIMGPSIAASALLWRMGSSILTRCAIFMAAGAATAFLTPFIRSLPPRVLPQAIEAYFLPVPGLSNFVFFPWMALVFAGAAVGVLLDGGVTPEVERRMHRRLAIGGAIVIAFAVTASYLPSPFRGSDFWTTSPAYVFIRAGLATVGVVGAYLWVRSWRPGSWSPLSQLGRTSLFIYWIHVELLYGLISRPWHRGLTFAQAGMAYLIFCALMLACSIGKERLAARFARPAVGPHATATAAVSPAQAPTRLPPSAG